MNDETGIALGVLSLIIITMVVLRFMDADVSARSECRDRVRATCLEQHTPASDCRDEIELRCYTGPVDG